MIKLEIRKKDSTVWVYLNNGPKKGVITNVDVSLLTNGVEVVYSVCFNKGNPNAHTKTFFDKDVFSSKEDLKASVLAKIDSAVD